MRPDPVGSVAKHCMVTFIPVLTGLIRLVIRATVGAQFTPAKQHQPNLTAQSIEWRDVGSVNGNVLEQSHSKEYVGVRRFDPIQFTTVV